MSQKSSLVQAAKSVSQALTGDKFVGFLTLLDFGVIEAERASNIASVRHVEDDVSDLRRINIASDFSKHAADQQDLSFPWKGKTIPSPPSVARSKSLGGAQAPWPFH